jgi:outer membrane protein assembly factor BamB
VPDALSILLQMIMATKCSTCFFTSPKYENGRIFYGSYAHDIRTNTLVFKDANYRNINAYLTTSLVDNIHFLYGGSGFVALDVITFTPKWTQYEGDFEHLSDKARIVSNVTILAGVVYLIFSDATLRALALEDGHEIGHWQAEHVVYSGDIKIQPGLARSDEMIFVTFGENRVYAFGRE